MTSMQKPNVTSSSNEESAVAPDVARRKPPYERVQNPTSWRRLALATWAAPDNPTVYGTIEVDMTESLALIERLAVVDAVLVTADGRVLYSSGLAPP